jgi:hypothetical protein
MDSTNYLLADPLSIATQGLLDEDIGISVLGWIVRVSHADSVVTVPLGPLLWDEYREWWVRKYFFEEPVGNYELDGPFKYHHARVKARDLSRENASGLTELVVFDGDDLCVVATYLRGKKRYQGLRAYQAAMYHIPPTT